MHEDDSGEVKVSGGDQHDFLAVDFIHNEDKGNAVVSVKKCVTKMMEQFAKDANIVIEHEPKTPAKDHLFVAGENGPEISKEKADTFHSAVAMGLHICKRARPDTLTTMAFLCARVLSPDADDWGKLIGLMGHMMGTEDLALALEPSECLITGWFVDGAFAVHNDHKSHTGGAPFIGEGAVNSISTEQKMNTKSGTEAEPMAADDVSGSIMWTRHFSMAQGCDAEDDTLHQDNKSATLSEENGKLSSSERTGHIDIGCFFLTDGIELKESKVNTGRALSIGTNTTPNSTNAKVSHDKRSKII